MTPRQALEHLAAKARRVCDGQAGGWTKEDAHAVLVLARAASGSQGEKPGRRAG